MASEQYRVMQSAVLVTSVAAEVRPKNLSRRYLLVQNNGADAVSLNINGEDRAGAWIRLQPGQWWESPANWCSPEALMMVGDAASNADVVIVEGV